MQKRRNSDSRDADSQHIWDSELQNARQKIGEAPRRFSGALRAQLAQRTYFTMLDSLGAILKRREELLQNGVVVWGCIVRADEEEIFKPGSKDMPADIVFCPDPRQQVNPTELIDIAAGLNADRGTRVANASYNRVMEYLEESRERAYGLEFSAGKYRNLMLSTILIERKYFPGSMVSTPVFPVLVLEDGAAMVLPDLFWPDTLRILSHEHIAKKYPYFWQRLHIPEKPVAIVIVVATLILVILLLVVQK